MNKPTIAILGLGAMGTRITANLIAADYSVIVWNRSPAPAEAMAAQGATVASSPRQAAMQADIVMSLVSDDTASQAVWLTPETGAVYGLKAESVALECSTLTLDWLTQLSQTIAAQGGALLAAPVVGSRPQAEAKKLIFLIGGEAATLARVQPVLAATSGTIFHVGSAVQGMAMKLAVNALFGIQVAAVAELLAMLDQQGISNEAAMACLQKMPVTSLAAQGAGALMVANQHQPMFPIHLVEKDFRYACDTVGKEQLPATSAVQQMYQQAIIKGYGDENISAIARLFNE